MADDHRFGVRLFAWKLQFMERKDNLTLEKEGGRSWLG